MKTSLLPMNRVYSWLLRETLSHFMLCISLYHRATAVLPTTTISRLCSLWMCNEILFLCSAYGNMVESHLPSQFNYVLIFHGSLFSKNVILLLLEECVEMFPVPTVYYPPTLLQGIQLWLHINLFLANGDDGMAHKSFFVPSYCEKQ